MTAARTLYLVRHGEALPDGSGLTANGRRQADLLGARLARRPVTAIHHGPLARAAQTAELIARHLPAAARHADEVAGDYVPYVPEPAELPADCADFVGTALPRVLAEFDAEQQRRGPELARAAVARFTGPVAGEQDQDVLLVTHTFLIGWLLRDALGAPPWRWLGVNQGNAALTVIRYAPGRPASVLVHNDTRHLTEEALRWTGLPHPLRV